MVFHGDDAFSGNIFAGLAALPSIGAFDDEQPAFFNGNERTVAIDLITDGILEAPRERCVRKRIFAPLGCNTLHLIIGCNERKISVPAPAYKGGSPERMKRARF